MDLLLTQKHNYITTIHPHIQKLFLPPIASSFMKSLQKEFHDPNLTERILTGYHQPTRCIITETWRETHFRIIHRRYSTFFCPSTTISATSHISKCPKCLQEKPSLLHCMWSCTHLKKYWRNILDYIQKVTKSKLRTDFYVWLFIVFPTQTSHTWRLC